MFQGCGKAFDTFSKASQFTNRNPQGPFEIEGRPQDVENGRTVKLLIHTQPASARQGLYTVVPP